MVTRTGKRKVRLSITVNPELKTLAEKVASETNTTPSGVISKCLEDLAKKRKEEALIEYYQETAKENKEFAESSIDIIQKIASTWKD